MKPKILISNDDGIESPFLPFFAKAMAKIADIEIVVPAYEQSWIGRAYSRHREIEVKECDFHGFKCITVTGTPSDCVNLALAHLCRKPDAVVSGLNIGQNIALPLLWSSGTFAAAVEAAGWGFPAFAFSMRLEKKYYEARRLMHKMPEGGLAENIKAASEKSAQFVADTLEKHKFEDGEIKNVNFPVLYTLDTPFEKCIPAHAMLSSLYVKNEEGNYNFSYSIGKTFSPTGELTDIDCLNSGRACYSTVNIKRA